MFSVQEKGYTLIELVIVVGLISLLSTVIILNGAESRNLVQLRTSAQQLESAFTQAQAYGNSGRAYPAGTTNFDNGYGVYITTDTTGGKNKIVIMYGGQGDLDTPPDGIQIDEEKYVAGQEYETITLGGNVVISNIDMVSGPSNRSEGHVLFRRGEAEAHVYSNNPVQKYDGMIITLASGSAEIDLNVYKTGLVYIVQ